MMAFKIKSCRHSFHTFSDRFKTLQLTIDTLRVVRWIAPNLLSLVLSVYITVNLQLVIISLRHRWLPTDIQVKHLITLVAHQSLVNLVNDMLKLAKETDSYLFADFRVM